MSFKSHIISSFNPLTAQRRMILLHFLTKDLLNSNEFSVTRTEQIDKKGKSSHLIWMNSWWHLTVKHVLEANYVDFPPFERYFHSICITYPWVKWLSKHFSALLLLSSWMNQIEIQILGIFEELCLIQSKSSFQDCSWLTHVATVWKVQK